MSAPITRPDAGSPSGPMVIKPWHMQFERKLTATDGRPVTIVHINPDGTVLFFDVSADGQKFCRRPYSDLGQPASAVVTEIDPMTVVVVGETFAAEQYGAALAFRLAGRSDHWFRRHDDGNLVCPHCGKSYRLIGPYGSHLSYRCGDRVGAHVMRTLRQPGKPPTKAAEPTITVTHPGGVPAVYPLAVAKAVHDAVAVRDGKGASHA